MDRIEQIAQKYNLFLLEDAAHAAYTQYKGRNIGAKNTVAFSFYATKNIATGEGGMLLTDDDEIAERARVLTCHGMSRNAWSRYAKGGSWRYAVEFAGYKYNMTDLQAALGLCQLGRLEDMQKIRYSYVELYNRELAEIRGVRRPVSSGLGRDAWHLYVIRIEKDELTIGRDEFIEELNALNIGTSVHFILVHLHPFYQEHFGTKAGCYPITEGIFEKIISLPLYPAMTQEDVLYVASAVREISEKHAK